MKSTIQTLVTLIFTCAASLSFGQITIQHYDFRLPVSPDTASLQLVAAGQSSINSGTAMNWNLSGVTAGAPYDYVLDPVTSPNFPNAMGQMEVPANLGGGLILDQLYTYYVQDMNSYSEVGFEIVGKAFSLGSQTGDFSDSLYTLDTVLNYNVPFLQYPMTYGDTWSSNTTLWIPMEATIESISWSRESLKIRQDITSNDSVAGYGSITLPSGASAQALLVKSLQVRVDSVFFNGAPMDPVFAQQFGFTQNDTTRLTKYSIYVKGINSAAYEYLVVDGVQTQPYFNRSQNISTDEWNAEPFMAFPNPASDRLTLIGNLDEKVYLMDLNGRLIFEKEIDANANEATLYLGDIASGVYILMNGEQRLKVTIE